LQPLHSALTLFPYTTLFRSKIPSASGLFNFARITAGSFGTSIATTFWDHRATLHHAQLVEHLGGPDGASSEALAGLQAGGMTPRSEEHTSELQSRGHLVCRL